MFLGGFLLGPMWSPWRCSHRLRSVTPRARIRRAARGKAR